jgi:hypothetical protein
MPAAPLLGLIADQRATLLYGWGGTGKGTNLAHKILHYLRADPANRVLLIDAERRPYEWIPRLNALGATEDELARILYYQPDSSPLWEQQHAIDQFLAERTFTPTLIVVDSVERACAVDLSTGNNEPPMLYYATLDSLCDRHLSLAHVSENASMKKPFGSKRWHDDARLTWSLEAKGDKRILTNRKINTGRPLQTQAIWVSEWSAGPVAYPSKVSEELYQEAVLEILKRIVTEPMDYDAMVELANEGIEDTSQHHTKNAVKLAISGNKAIFTKVGGTARKPIYDRIRAAEPYPAGQWTCHLCKGPLEQDEAENVTDGDIINRVHRGGCPDQEAA